MVRPSSTGRARTDPAHRDLCGRPLHWSVHRAVCYPAPSGHAIPAPDRIASRFLNCYDRCSCRGTATPSSSPSTPCCGGRPTLRWWCRRGAAATVGEVDGLARAAGGLLGSGGLPPGALVGLAAPNGPGMLASLLALLRAGLPALLLDAQAPAAEGLRACQALGAAALLTAGRRWPEGAGDWTLARLEPGEPGAHSDLGAEPAAARALPPETAVVKLTSGSTGSPRGIATAAAALVADDRALAAIDGPAGRRPPARRHSDVALLRPVEPGDAGAGARHRAGGARGAELLEPFAAAESGGATVFPTAPPTSRRCCGYRSRRPGRPPCGW